MKLYSTKQFADILGVSAARVRALALSGRCGSKLGRDWVFNMRDIKKCQTRTSGRPSH